MIRAGRTALTDVEVALAYGYVSLRAAKRGGLFEQPTLPAPINRRGGEQRRNKPLWDAAQIHARASGEQVPELPTTDHPDDLLDAPEAAAVWGVEPGSWEYYRRTRPHLIPQSVEVGGVRHWRRGDVVAFPRPGQGAGAGRPAGVTDSRPERGDVAAAVLELLAEEPRSGYQLAKEVTERSGGDWKPTNVHAVLHRFEADGLIKGEKAGRSTLYRLTETGRHTPVWQAQQRGSARLQRVKEILAQAQARGAERAPTAKEVAAELEISEDHARRLINQAQQR